MSRIHLAQPVDERMPRAWRFVLVALCTLILCSCRGPVLKSRPSPALPRGGQGQMVGAPMVGAQVGMAGESLPPTVYSGPTAFAPGEAPVNMPPGVVAPVGPWVPPGIAGPWPQDEYVVDGGDRNLPAQVNRDWTIHGLDAEDTIGHFDTLDGRTLVAASNPVFVYAPRFGAVRKIDGLVAGERIQSAGDVNTPTHLVRCDEVLPPMHADEHIQLGRGTSVAPPVIYESTRGSNRISSAFGLREFQNSFLPYENLQAIRFGRLDHTESARLAQGIAAAVIWSHDAAVQVILDKQTATEDMSVARAESLFTVKDPPGNPALRVIKIASTQFAQPGDVIDFTIRFDNVGNQVIGNVTLVDNLSGRLEYVADSTQCSLPAEFVAQPNESGSATLRWEIRDPLPRGQGGILRFRCRVR